MSDAQMPPAAPQTTTGWLDPGPANVQLIYILYLVGFLVGITTIIGLVLAYMNRGKSEAWVDTHYTWAIRTFWIAVLGSVVSLILMIAVVGFFLMIAVAVWVIVRCIVGLQKVGRGEPIANPQSWML
ncbi:MAG: membrane protein [Alphaproteobacteria bacterium]|nr:MAG: membrane protein [Alphaproteobacteria bacterium]